ncbi:hypothetical protein ANN_07842 [Periplaneta americana]|uniref:Nudix hydrolase domain-containing protein n=1 Tax=Periplaneta americana TaxID=6978 RepID=A0ABQ8T0X8_PERAM|nr:hypothetical protein ANN_07842 [Periplaneta americana]
MWIWRRMEHVKWTDRIRNEAVLERVSEERMMLKLIRKRKRNWLGHWLRRNCLLKDALEGMVNGRRVRGRRRYQMIDDIKIYGSYAETRQKIGMTGECWVCSERRALGQNTMYENIKNVYKSLFGIRNYGVDINGYVMDPEKGLCIWLQRRSATKQTWPGKWDNMVGGGLSVGYGILETAIKEAAEEASIPAELIAKLRPAGCVSFFFESERGLFPNTEFVFDLELPADFIPNNSDGEVETFELLPAEEALEKVFSTEFKTTSCPVVIDFLIRHGFISPETEMTPFHQGKSQNDLHYGVQQQRISICYFIRSMEDHRPKKATLHKRKKPNQCKKQLKKPQDNEHLADILEAYDDK